jgi:glycosyltransferase involved in cell wall biosynthesis
MYFPVEAVKGLRRLGHSADYMVFDDTGEGWLCNRAWDINLGLNRMNRIQRISAIIRFIAKSLHDYDIFHFHSGRTMVPLVRYSRWSMIPAPLNSCFSFLDYIDLPLLKKMNKKIVFHFWGCDIRPKEKDAAYEYSCCLDCSGDMLSQCTNGHKEKMLEKARKYGDLLLGEGDLALTLPELTWLNNAVDTTTFTPLFPDQIPSDFRLPASGRTRIYHSHFNAEERGDVKGTSYIRDAIRELNDEGYALELMHFSKLPREKLKYFQMQADIVIDQLRCGSFGSTAVECMACGKPVICYLRDDVRAKYPKDLPIVHADIHTIKERLRQLIDNGSAINEIGSRSRQYAVTHHDTMVVAKELERLYYGL